MGDSCDKGRAAVRGVNVNVCELCVG